MSRGRRHRLPAQCGGTLHAAAPRGHAQPPLVVKSCEARLWRCSFRGVDSVKYSMGSGCVNCSDGSPVVVVQVHIEAGGSQAVAETA
jgi:hypothetical protein